MNNENLTPFTSETGRIAGQKSKRKSWKAKVSSFLEKVEGDSEESRTDRLLASVYREALDGNIQACNFLADRGFGKPTEYIEQTSEVSHILVTEEERAFMAGEEEEDG